MDIWNTQYEDLLQMSSEDIQKGIVEAFENKQYPYFQYTPQELKQKIHNITHFEYQLDDSKDVEVFMRGYDFFNEFFIDHFVYPVKIITKVDQCESIYDLFSKKRQKIYKILLEYNFLEFLKEYPEKYAQLKLRNGIFQDYMHIHRLDLNVKESSHFSILLSYIIFTYYSRNKKNFTIFDPCMGWGERLTGAGLAGVSKYVGCDPNSKLFKKYPQIINFIGSRVKFEINNVPAEEYRHKQYYDLIFTSPPYFDKEIYTQEKTQSYIKFNTFESWENEFLIPTFVNAIQFLKPDGYLIIYMPFNLNLFRALKQRGMIKAPKIFTVTIKSKTYKCMTMIKR